MNQDFLIGTALLGIGLVLIVIGWPKGGKVPVCCGSEQHSFYIRRS